MIDAVSAALLEGLSRLLSRLPAAPCALLPALGEALALIPPLRAGEIRENLLRSDLAIPRGRIPGLVRRIFRHQAANLVEFLRLPLLTRERLPGIVSFRGLEHFDRALARGRGAVLLTAHFGNWEYLGAALSLAGYPLRSMVRNQGKRLDEAVNGLRALSGNVLFDRNRSGRKILRALQENAIVGVLADQHSDNAGVRVDFLGRPCMATSAPVAFALKSGAPLIPAFDLRLSFERHEVIVLPPIGLERTGDRERDLAVGTRRAQKVIETMVRRHPEQWFWFHRRWRA